jgi:hypothetical protein
MQTAGAFLGKKKNDTATDLSGIACMAPNGASRICLAVNDENKNAQFVTIEGNQITVGQPVTLIGDAPDQDRTNMLGEPPLIYWHSRQWHCAFIIGSPSAR